MKLPQRIAVKKK